MRRFRLVRLEDETGISGVGHIADGVRFEDGRCALRWRTELRSTAVYDGHDELMEIHGHDGKTVCLWLDPAVGLWWQQPDKMTEDRCALRVFCTRCFADDQGGSWGEGVVPSTRSTHCLNCGSGGSGVVLPAWAVDDVRKNGSWVCKRYYPHDEDKARADEREALLALVPEFPGRVALRNDDGDGFTVSQRTHEGITSIIVSDAGDEAEALERARKSSLPYVPEPPA